MSTTSLRNSPSRSLDRCRRPRAARRSVLGRIAPFSLVAILASGCPPKPVTVPVQDTVAPSVELELFDGSGVRLSPAFGDSSHRRAQPESTFVVSGSAEDSGGVRRMRIMKAIQTGQAGAALASRVLDRNNAVETMSLLPTDKLSAGDTRIYHADAEDFHANKSDTGEFFVHAAARCSKLGFQKHGSPGPVDYDVRTEATSRVLQVMNLRSRAIELTYYPDAGRTVPTIVIPGKTVVAGFVGLPGTGTWYAKYQDGDERILVCFS